jgi:hypothetical protein
MFLFNWINKCVQDGVVRDDLTLGVDKSLVTKFVGTLYLWVMSVELHVLYLALEFWGGF